MNGHLIARYSRMHSKRMNLSDRLDAAMRKKGLSQSELMRRSGVPQPTISRILKGTTQEPDLETLRSLANALGMTLEQMTGDAGDAANSTIRGVSQPLSEEANHLISEIDRLDRLGGLPRKMFPIVRRLLGIASESTVDKIYAPSMKDAREAERQLSKGFTHESEHPRRGNKSR